MLVGPPARISACSAIDHSWHRIHRRCLAARDCEPEPHSCLLITLLQATGFLRSFACPIDCYNVSFIATIAEG